MITLFLSPSCTSCRKAKAWLDNHKVPFQEHNIMTSPLSRKELQQILSLTENGTDDIISTRSKIFQKLNIDVESISVTELLNLIEQYPSLCVVLSSLMINVCRLALMKMRFVHFFLVVTVSKN